MFACTSCTLCHCRQQVWILTLLLSRGLQLWMQDSRAKAEGSTKKASANCFLSKQFNASSRVQPTAWSWISVCSLCHHRAFTGSKSYRQLQTWRQSFQKFSRCIFPLLCTLPLHCTLPLLSLSVHREKVLKLVHRPPVSLSLHTRLDVHDQRWQLSISVLVTPCSRRVCSSVTGSIIS